MNITKFDTSVSKCVHLTDLIVSTWNSHLRFLSQTSNTLYTYIWTSTNAHIYSTYRSSVTRFPFIFIPQNHRSLCCTVTCLRLISGLSGCNIQLILWSQHSPMSSLLEFLTNHVFTWTIARGWVKKQILIKQTPVMFVVVITPKFVHVQNHLLPWWLSPHLVTSKAMFPTSFYLCSHQWS